MKIIRAAELGMCFGVRDALEIASRVSDPKQVTIHGELVHNPTVVHQLDLAGFRQVSEVDRTGSAETPYVLITVHGVSNQERGRLQREGKRLIDTTCPLVRKAHDAAQELQAEGRHVILIGKPGHVEVQGIAEDLTSFDIISDPQEVITYARERIGVVCQTTTPPELVSQILEEVRSKNHDADVRFIDTVCHPTKRRQSALLDLIGRVDAVVVVGGKNSNNTRRLVQLCEDHSVPSFHVANANELDEGWFGGIEVVGLTAGTSTLDATIDAVHQELGRISDSIRHSTASRSTIHPTVIATAKKHESM